AAGDIANRLDHRVHQGAAFGQERLAGQVPVQLIVQVMLGEHHFDTRLQLRCRHFGGKTEVEHHFALARNHVGGTGASVDIGDLEAGRREELVAVVPGFRGQFGQHRGDAMNRVVGQVRVGDMALHTLDAQYTAERTTATVLDDIADHVGRRRFADDAVVDLLIALLQVLDHLDGAVDRRAFLVRSNQQADGAAVFRVGINEFLKGDHERRYRAFHVGGTAAVQHAAADLRLERR